MEIIPGVDLQGRAGNPEERRSIVVALKLVQNMSIKFMMMRGISFGNFVYWQNMGLRISKFYLGEDMCAKIGSIA